VKKNKDILNCHSPILTCLLLCEFLKKLKTSYSQYSALINGFIAKLGKLCKNIQKSVHEEDYIYFLMTQKDIKQRSAFQIAEINNFYFAMETLEVELIVNKMWNGKLTYNSFYSHSSLYNFIKQGTELPFDSFDIVDMNKTYIFHLNLWFQSCSLRYSSELISSIVILAVYNVYVNSLVTNNSVMSNYSSLDLNNKLLLYLYIILAMCLNLNILNTFLYHKMLRKQFSYNFWFIIDSLIMTFALTLLIDIESISGESVDNEYNIPYIIKSSLLIINNVLVWLKLGGSLLTLRHFGPIMRITYLLSFATAKYLVIYLLFLLCCVSIFTAIFYKSGNDLEAYNNFSHSLSTLFNGFINVFDCFSFQHYQVFGSLSMVIFVTFASMVLMSILTALQVSVFKQYNRLANALHRISLIRYYKRYKWDKKFGFLIFLPTPLNVISLIVFPFVFKFNTKRLNLIICKIYFCLFYFPWIFIFQTLGEIIFIPICYFKAFFSIFYHGSNFISKFLYFLIWIFLGLFFLLKTLLRDKYIVFRNLFKINKTQKKNIKKFITANEVQTFLEFIHSRGKEESNELQTIFQDFLNYDLNKKAQNDLSIKEKVNYIDKLNEGIKSKHLQHPSKFLYKQNDNSEFRRVCRRNLVILDLLEKFSIDDESRENQAIDIDRLKNLLPKTTVIDNAFFKRIIYTDIKALNRALKLKQKQIQDEQNRLLNKAMKSSIIADMFVDNLVKGEKLFNPDNDTDILNDINNLFNNISKGVKETMHQNIKAMLRGDK
jgi:hypothetical protein